MNPGMINLLKLPPQRPVPAAQGAEVLLRNGNLGSDMGEYVEFVQPRRRQEQPAQDFFLGRAIPVENGKRPVIGRDARNPKPVNRKDRAFAEVTVGPAVIAAEMKMRQ